MQAEYSMFFSLVELLVMQKIFYSESSSRLNLFLMLSISTSLAYFFSCSCLSLVSVIWSKYEYMYFLRFQFSVESIVLVHGMVHPSTDPHSTLLS